MGMIEFKVPGEPVGKQRHRTTKTSHTYTPKKTEQYESLVRLSFNQAVSGKNWIPLDVPVRLHVTAYFTIPKSRQIKDIVSQPKTTKPDADNILKSVKDGLNSVAYTDDSRVYYAAVGKYEHLLGPFCHVQVVW